MVIYSCKLLYNNNCFWRHLGFPGIRSLPFHFHSNSNDFRSKFSAAKPVFLLCHHRCCCRRQNTEAKNFFANFVAATFECDVYVAASQLDSFRRCRSTFENRRTTIRATHFCVVEVEVSVKDIFEGETSLLAF